MGKRKGVAQQLDPPTWQEFVLKYERFTDVLCEAAKTGCPSRLDKEYILLRRWFLEYYIVFGGRLKPYLNYSDPSKTIMGSNVQKNQKSLHVLHRSTGMRRKMDFFEMVFRPTTLNGVLGQDSGELIERVSVISDAIYRCVAEHTPAEE